MGRTRRVVAFSALGLATLLVTPLLRPLWRERVLRGVARPLDVLLLTLDTTRADRLGCYGHRSAGTPGLDSLARGGVLFRRAYSHVPLTLPSHASILTGVLPTRHGIHDNGGFVLGHELPTLAEAFLAGGYRTGAFVSAFVLDRRFGLARGFGTYEDEMPAGSREGVGAEVAAEVTAARALAWLGREDARPFFAWVHFYDAHDPYVPPEPFAARFRDQAYDGEIAYVDFQVGRLLDALRERPRPCLVAVIADHGEALGEHGELTHGYFVYEASQHVPMILSLPGRLPAGEVVEPVVRAVDLAPTLLDVAGLPPMTGLDGRTLVGLITRRQSGEPGPAYVESYWPRLWWGAQELLGLRTGQWLFIRSPRPELYDLEADPRQEHDLAARQPERLEELGRRLQAWLPPGDPLAARAPVDAETAQKLGALGYVASGSTAASPQLRDAKDNAPLLISVTRAREEVAARRFDAALASYGDALRENAESVVVRAEIASTLAAMGRHEEAFDAWRKLAEEHPAEESYPVALVQCRLGQRRVREALVLSEEALGRFPDSAALREARARVFLELGRPAEAEPLLREAISREPRRGSARVALAIALERLGRLPEASAVLQEAAAKRLLSQDALGGLARLGDRLLQSKEPDEARSAYRAALQGGLATEGLHVNLARACSRLGRREEALEALLAGRARLPDAREIHYLLARLLQEAGRGVEAEREYRSLLLLEPGRQDARLGLASLLEATDRSGEAGSLYREVLASGSALHAAAARTALARMGGA